MPKKTPKYPLELVHKAAESGKVNMLRRAFNQSRDLGYQSEDVWSLILSLETSNFLKTYDYDDGIYDGYEINDVMTDDNKITIFIKLRLADFKLGGINLLQIRSFHI